MSVIVGRGAYADNLADAVDWLLIKHGPDFDLCIIYFLCKDIEAFYRILL